MNHLVFVILSFFATKKNYLLEMNSKNVNNKFLELERTDE